MARLDFQASGLGLAHQLVHSPRNDSVLHFSSVQGKILVKTSFRHTKFNRLIVWQLLVVQTYLCLRRNIQHAHDGDRQSRRIRHWDKWHEISHEGAVWDVGRSEIHGPLLLWSFHLCAVHV